MGVAGAALATVLAQAVSVVLCLAVTKKRGLPFRFEMNFIRFNRKIILKILLLVPRSRCRSCWSVFHFW